MRQPQRTVSNYRQMIRAARSRIGRTAVIYPAAFMVATGLGCVGLGLIFHMKEVLGASPARIGWLSPCYFAAYTLGCYGLRPRFDRVPPRYSLVIGTFGMGVFSLGLAFVPAIEWAYVLQALSGLSASLFWPILMGWVSLGLEGGELNKTLSRFNLGWSGGSIVSPYLGGWLSRLSAPLPIYVGGGIFLATAVLITGAALALPKVRHERVDVSSAPAGNTHTHPRTPLRFGCWVVLFTAYVAIGVLSFIWPIAARDDLHMSKPFIGFLLLLRTLSTTAAFLVLGRTARWHFRGVPLMVGQFLFAVTLLVLSATQKVWLIGAAFAGAGVCLAFSYSNSVFHGVAGSRNRARQMAIHESLLAVGFAVGAVFGGWVYEAFSMARVYLLCVGFILAGILVHGVVTWLAGRSAGRAPSVEAVPLRR
ncbi:MAG: MFS transporter [Kiritimatiellae bacterium]|nr:MFS transporter [Kiritimatiellia bacterium]